MFKKFFSWIKSTFSFKSKSEFKHFVFTSRYDQQFTVNDCNRRDTVALIMTCVWEVILECAKLYFPTKKAYAALFASIIGILAWQIH